ncbi:MAG: hypothetical protein AAF226_03335 [Verrucomicrobiota bacterium]
MKKLRNLLLGAAAVVALSGVGYTQDEDLSVEGLYRKAGGFVAAGDMANASKTFEQMFDLSGGTDTLFEDYGPGAGGFFFDYAGTLIPQQRWQDAKTALETCINSDEIAERVGSVIQSTNQRKNSANYRLGIVEAAMENHGEAVRLYDLYLANNPDPKEIQMLRADFKLKRGASLLKLGRTEEGVTSIQEIFDNKDEWRVSPNSLMTGIFELSSNWANEAGKAEGDLAKIQNVEARAHAFLDKNLPAIDVAPFDKFRFQFADRLLQLGADCTKKDLHSVALRFFSEVPTLAEISGDIDLRLAQLPLGAGVPPIYQQYIDEVQRRNDAPFHPDAQALMFTAQCYEKLGNMSASRNAYWYLAEHHPDLDVEMRARILHEASRLSAMNGDYNTAQYFGEKFMKEMPEDHELRNNVAAFTIQSLFTSGQFDLVVKVCESVFETNTEAG